MQVTFTARHFKASEPLKTYAEKEVARLERYMDGIVGCEIILTQERSQYIADITVKTRFARLTVKEITDDFFKSIDQAVDKLERQIKKQKKKFRNRDRERIGEVLLTPSEEEEAEM